MALLRKLFPNVASILLPVLTVFFLSSLVCAAESDPRELLESPPTTTVPQPKTKIDYQKSALWQSRAKIDTIIGYKTIPSPGNPSKIVFTNGGKASINANQSGNINQASQLFGCNRGTPPSVVVPTFEDSGISSAVVSLRIWNGGGWVALCSGALLSSRIVMTAAHCLYDTEDNYWYFGPGNPLLVSARRNGASDSSVRSVYASDGIFYTAYHNHNTWQESLRAGSDVAVLYLDSALSSQNLPWSAPSPSMIPRTNYGYPGRTGGGSALTFDVADKAQVTGCSGYASSILCEEVSVEGGMSGGPILHPSGIILGTCSGGVVNGCPTYYAGLTGTYTLKKLVEGFCSVSTSTIGGRAVFRSTC